MTDFQGRRSVRRLIYSKITVLVLFASALFIANGAWGAYLKYDEARSRMRAAEEALAALAAREETLKRDIAEMKTGHGLEKKIRENFGLVREGEKAIIIVEPQNKPKQEKSEPTPSAWTRAKLFLKGE